MMDRQPSFKCDTPCTCSQYNSLLLQDSRLIPETPRQRNIVHPRQILYLPNLLIHKPFQELRDLRAFLGGFKLISMLGCQRSGQSTICYSILASEHRSPRVGHVQVPEPRDRGVEVKVRDAGRMVAERKEGRIRTAEAVLYIPALARRSGLAARKDILRKVLMENGTSTRSFRLCSNSAIIKIGVACIEFLVQVPNLKRLMT